MVDTPRTKSYLIGTSFVDGQPVKSVGTPKIRDFVESVPLWDESAGVAQPNILRGTVNVVKYITANGGATGSMAASTATRAVNGTQFQNAINYAENNGKFFEFEPALIEINNSAGVTVHGNGGNDDYRGVVWKGTRASIIRQFASNAPILTLGDVATSANGLAGATIEGAWLQYGGSQTGQTSAIALRIGSLAWCTIKQIDTGVPATTSSAPYIGCRVYCATAGNWLFSCSLEDLKFWMAQNTLLSLESGLTGNKWDNIYLNNGAVGTYNTLSGNFLFIDVANGNCSDEWGQLNCEWGACNQVIRILAPYSAKFGHVHIEGTKLTGTTPVLIYTEDGAYQMDAVECTNIVCQVAGGSIFSDWNGDGGDGSSNIKIGSFLWKSYDLGTGDNVTQNMNMFSYQGSGLGGDQSIVEVGQGVIIDDQGDVIPRLQFDSHMPLASFKMPPRWQKYEFGTWASKVDKPIINVSAAYTVYGQHNGVTVIVPASITGFTLTLGLVMGATGTQPVDTGAVISVLRLAGTWSGTLSVVSSGGATLTTSNQTGAQANTRYWYRFNGTAWVTFTPVTF